MRETIAMQRFSVSGRERESVCVCVRGSISAEAGSYTIKYLGADAAYTARITMGSTQGLIERLSFVVFISVSEVI